MQERMEKYQLSKEEITTVLTESSSGGLATINSDGSPYATPIQFVYQGGRLYFHGRIICVPMPESASLPIRSKVYSAVRRVSHAAPTPATAVSSSAEPPVS